MTDSAVYPRAIVDPLGSILHIVAVFGNSRELVYEAHDKMASNPSVLPVILLTRNRICIHRFDVLDITVLDSICQTTTISAECFVVCKLVLVELLVEWLM